MIQSIHPSCQQVFNHLSGEGSRVTGATLQTPMDSIQAVRIVEFGCLVVLCAIHPYSSHRSPHPGGLGTREMNVDFKRVREATFNDGPSPAAKRRALSLSSPPPVEDGTEEDRLEDWMKVVEVSGRNSRRCLANLRLRKSQPGGLSAPCKRITNCYIA